MDLRTRTSLVCGAVALAIAASLLLRRRTNRVHHLTAAFAAATGLWYLAQWLYLYVRADVWARFTSVLALILPQLALHVFAAVVPRQERGSRLLRDAGLLLVPMLLLVLLPWHQQGWVRRAVFVYVAGLLAAGLYTLGRHGARSRSRATQRRVRFLVLAGAAAAVFSVADFLWFLGAPIPPVGAVLGIVFLFALSESVVRERLVDLYDVLGQLLVSTALAFLLGGIFVLFDTFLGGIGPSALVAILTALVILVLFEPLRAEIDARMTDALFRERASLEREVARARARLATTLEPRPMAEALLEALEASRRVTRAALYLRGPVSDDLALVAAFGVSPPEAVASAAIAPLVGRLERQPSLALEALAEAVAEARRQPPTANLAEDERVLAAAHALGPLRSSLCLPLRSAAHAVDGLLLVNDERVRDAFSTDEVALLESLAVSAAVVLDSSRLYQQIRRRERLAELGQMAAGLAHELKNPLGAIKGAAQLLADDAGAQRAPTDREFLQIIVDEVDRLARVVGAVLDYARPATRPLGPVDVNALAERVTRLASADLPPRVALELDLTAELPRVLGDSEQLAQVLHNLIANAREAIAAAVRAESVGPAAGAGSHASERRGGTIRVTTGLLPGKTGHVGHWVELAVRDDGPGIPPAVQAKLFVPFFTTRADGTGLGLAISQRLVEDMGGRIELSSAAGQGAAFSVLLRPAPESDSSGRASVAASGPSG